VDDRLSKRFERELNLMANKTTNIHLNRDPNDVDKELN